VIDRWQECGFAPIATEYISKLQPKRGVRYAIDYNGDLSVHRLGKPSERRALLPVLGLPSWLDPETRGPRL
jgi:hypothetical protein